MGYSIFSLNSRFSNFVTDSKSSVGERFLDFGDLIRTSDWCELFWAKTQDAFVALLISDTGLESTIYFKEASIFTVQC